MNNDNNKNKEMNNKKERNKKMNNNNNERYIQLIQAAVQRYDRAESMKILPKNPTD